MKALLNLTKEINNGDTQIFGANTMYHNVQGRQVGVSALILQFLET